MLAMKGDCDPLVELLLKQMTSMQTQLQNMSSNTGTLKYTKSDQINPKTGQPWKRYCWSCWCCPHWGKNCPDKKEGHKNEATFKNRMEGSNKKCKWYDRGATLLQKLYDKIYLGGKDFYKHLVSNVVTSSKPVMKADSGASQTYIKKEHSHF